MQPESQQQNCPTHRNAELDREADLPIQPGHWLGVMGGGQLGRMFTHAAQRLGYRVAVFESERDCPAGQVADHLYCAGSYEGPEAESTVCEMAGLCKAVTLEFENVPSHLIRLIAEHTQANPCAAFLEACQDRVKEKESVAQQGCPTTPFLPVTCQSDANRAAEQLGLPLVIKTARSGYDGKGQIVVRSHRELQAVFQHLESSHLIAEQWIDFVAEVSMITARSARGEVVHYPLIENEHANHILDVSHCPVRPDFLGLQTEAERICGRIAQAFSVVGLFCVEFFVSKEGRLLVNEIAPRPHNSGHLTIEAFDISQFDMQVRAICNLPLRRPIQKSPASMANLLGDIWSNGTPDWPAALRIPQAYLHLYGKSEARPGRKMGHITLLDPQNSRELVREARRLLTNPTGQAVV